MSNPLATIFNGDVTIEVGGNIGNFGNGDLNLKSITSIATLSGTQQSTNSGTGALVVAGGVGIGRDTNILGKLTVSSTSSLQTTLADTTLGVFSVSGGNSFLVSVVNPISIQSTSNVTMQSLENQVLVYSGLNSNNAIQIEAQNAGGGINLLSGQTGKISLTAGTGGFDGKTSSGPLLLTAVDDYMTIGVSGGSTSQDLTLQVLGAFDNSLIIQSEATNTTKPAIVMQTTSVNGDIYIQNTGGSSSQGMVRIIGGGTGGGGVIVTSDTAGPISLTARGAASQFLVTTSSDGNHLMLGTTGGNTNSEVQLVGSGNDIGISLTTMHVDGNILVQNGTAGGYGSTGYINFYAGSGGLNIDTVGAGGFTVESTGGNVDIKAMSGDVILTATGGNSLSLFADRSATDALKFQSLGVTGGISLFANGNISIQSSDNSAIGGIDIGTAYNVPVKIGQSGQTTTIYGNLNVVGTTTTIDSVVSRIDDNFVELNSGPSTTADAGVAIRRWQYANNSGDGDVVTGTGEPHHNLQAQTSLGGANTVKLNVSAINSNDIYNGYWIKILSGAGSGQVRRIKEYDGASQTATIYGTADQSGILGLTAGDPQPQGLDWVTQPDNTSYYSLYPCSYILAYWDEGADRYKVTCSKMVQNTAGNLSASQDFVHYVDMQVRNIYSENVDALTINNSTADITFNVTLDDNSSSTVSMAQGANVTAPGFPSNHGVYIVMARPVNDTSSRPAAIWLIGKIGDDSVCGQVVRVIGVKGTNGSNLDIQWPTGGFKPELYYRPHPGISASTTQYRVKVISV